MSKKEAAYEFSKSHDEHNDAIEAAILSDKWLALMKSLSKPKDDQPKKRVRKSKKKPL